MARGSSLSDDRVIDEINREFIAVDNNISDQGWPEDTPALDRWHAWLDRHERNARNGFTTSVVITPDGRMPLGTSGSGHVSEWHASICYDPGKYYKFLTGSLEKFRRLNAITMMPDPQQRSVAFARLQQEIWQENRDRNNPNAAYR